MLSTLRLVIRALARRGEAVPGKYLRHAMMFERLESGVSAKSRIMIRRWLSKIAAELHQGG
jgi:hypothetical protein